MARSLCALEKTEDENEREFAFEKSHGSQEGLPASLPLVCSPGTFPCWRSPSPPPPASLQGPLSFQTSPRHQGHPHHLFDSMSALLPHLPSLPPTSCSLWVLVTSSLPLPLSASVPSSSPGPPSLSLSSCRVSQLLSGLQQPPLAPSSAPRASPALPCGGASVVPKPSLAPHCQQIKSPNSLT